METLLKSAGILHEDDMARDDSSDDETEVLEKWDARYQRPDSSAVSSNRSSMTQDTENYAGGGDLDSTSIFKQHEQDDSRYYGRSLCCISNQRRQANSGSRSIMFIINTFPRWN